MINKDIQNELKRQIKKMDKEFNEIIRGKYKPSSDEMLNEDDELIQTITEYIKNENYYNLLKLNKNKIEGLEPFTTFELYREDNHLYITLNNKVLIQIEFEYSYEHYEYHIKNINVMVIKNTKYYTNPMDNIDKYKLANKTLATILNHIEKTIDEDIINEISNEYLKIYRLINNK